MDKLFGFIGDYNDPRIGGGDSFCDRLNCSYTVTLLIIFALLVTSKQYYGEPINCWCPPHFESSHVDFTNAVCWVQNTYYLPYDERIPKEHEDRDQISFYQWVGFFLCLQAICFYLPRGLWRLFNKKAGIAVSTITDAAIECQNSMDNEKREKTLKYMTKHMSRFLMELSRKSRMHGKAKKYYYLLRYGNYLVILYPIIKAIYISNVVLQIFILNAFLGTNYNFYGFEIMGKLMRGEDLTNSKRFPRITMCDFKIRRMGNVQRYTVQCALPINLYNEIIFIFIWFWFVFVAIATSCSFCLWVFRAFYIKGNYRYIKTRLIAMDKLKRAPDWLVERFICEYLRRDGVFVLRMVARNSSDLIAAELVTGLWDQYKCKRQAIEGPVPNIDADEDKVAQLNHDVENNLRRRRGSRKNELPLIVLPSAPPEPGDERPPLHRSESQDTLIARGACSESERETDYEEEEEEKKKEEKKMDNRERDRERRMERRDRSLDDS